MALEMIVSVNSLSASVKFNSLVITFASRLGPDQKKFFFFFFKYLQKINYTAMPL